MATLSDIRTRIKRSLEISSTDYDDQIDDAIRTAIKQYQGHPLWFLEAKNTITLTTGNSSVALPSNFASAKRFRLLVNGAYYSDRDGFDYYDFQDLEESFRGTTPSGQPRRCAIFDGNLYVDTEADQDYTIDCTYFKKDATEPTNDSDTSVWLDDGREAIRTLAMAIFKDEDMEYDATQQDWARADRYYQDLVRTNNYRSGVSYA